MKQIVVVFIIVLACAVHVFAEDGVIPGREETGIPEYTLEDLFAIGISRSDIIKLSEEDVFIAERNRDKALAALLPRVAAFGQHTRYSEEKTAGAFTIQPERSSSWGARVGQSFSLGGREITAFRISKQDVERSGHDLSAVKEEYLLKIAEAYYDVLKARKGVDIARANVERLGKYRDEAGIRLKVGEVSKTAVLRAESELSGAQAELIKAKNILALAKAVLARVAGIEESYELRESVTRDEPEAEAARYDTVEPLKQTAFAERAEMKSAAIRKKNSEYAVAAARAAHWPYLSLEGVYLKRDESPSSSFFNDESIYGLFRIDFPLFEGGLRRAEVREAEARQRQAVLGYEDLKKTIEVEVEAAYLDVQTQAGILQSLKDQLRFAGDNYDAVTRQFSSGLASSIDVIDANTILVSAERQLSKARYDYELAKLRLQRATGTLLKSAGVVQEVCCAR